jgi:3'-5' exoribonuclease
MIQIKDLISGKEVTTFFLIKTVEVKQTRTTPPRDYLDFVLADQSGEINAKFWDATPLDIGTYQSMQLVQVKGLVQLYNKKTQIKVEQMRKATEQDGVTLSQFIRSAPIAPEQLVSIIEQTAQSIDEPWVRQIVQWCMDKTSHQLLSHPAAKSIHHAFYGGLAYHIVRMLELAEFLIEQRPFLKGDLLRAGIILHDLAKTVELDAEQGVVSDYSLSGKLLGHISIASHWIVEAALYHGYDLSDERILVLQHIVLSHHNKLEYGSPVVPKIPEAIALHYIDLIDSRLQAVEDAIQGLSAESSWTSPIKAVENESIYKFQWPES